MTSTPVGMRCPECARQRTRVRGAGSTSNDPVLTYVLIGICVAAFIGQASGGAGATGFGSSRLLEEGALSEDPVGDGEYWRLVTAGFLHGGFFHLFVNMFSLWILGSLLEPAIGRLRFGLIFFVSVLAGSFGALIVDPDALTVGASGGIFGLMGAALIVTRSRGLNVMESGLGLWLGINLLITFTFSGISVGGHIGGLIGGCLAAVVLFDLPSAVRVPPAAVNLLCAGIGAAAVAGSIAVAT
jgi:membrane associated rhomboid family serine protease